VEVRVIPCDARYLPSFASLNREWITAHFRLEPMDLHQLENPDATILALGGEIFFVLEDGRAVGTCAMIPHAGADAPSFELAKMAVEPAARGRGYGDLLMEAAISWARKKGARTVEIISNTRLAPAIALYRKHGFEIVRLGQHPDYERGDIEMRLRLSS
jgi:GNAT superfamily N-acetyltransferase